MAYSGVVRIESDSGRGSGVLIDDRWLLTAAHVVEKAPASEWEVIFERGWFDSSRSVQSIILHDEYNPQTQYADLALVKLKTPAPEDTSVYSLYTDSLSFGTPVSLEGYGDRWASDSYGFWTGVPLLQVSYNTVDTDTQELGFFDDASGLVFDYDNGSRYMDTLGQLFDQHHTGLGAQEGFIGPGDSGGGLFVDDELAGILSYLIEYGRNDTTVNGGYGEVGVAQSIVHYYDWIASHVPGIDPLPEPDTGADYLPGADTSPNGELFTASWWQAARVALLYEAALDRQPDIPGLNYWIDQYESGTSLVTIADGFLYSREFGGFPSRASSYVDRLYDNVLDRDPDPAGWDYWMEQLEEGMSPAEVLTRFADSAENWEQAKDWLPGLQQTGTGDWLIA